MNEKIDHAISTKTSDDEVSIKRIKRIKRVKRNKSCKNRKNTLGNEEENRQRKVWNKR